MNTKHMTALPIDDDSVPDCATTDQASSGTLETDEYSHPWATRIVFATVAIVSLAFLFTPGFVADVVQALVRRESTSGLLHPAILIVSIMILLWERYWPVGQRQVSGPAQVTDLLWWLTNATLAVGAPVLAVTLLRKGESAVTSDAERFDLFAGLPWPARYVIAILLVDFVRYAVHVSRHKIPLLWRFHATHHSTRQLNQFSAYRMHPVDYVFSVAVAAIPFSLFSIPVEGLVVYQVVTGVLGRTHHACVSWRWPVINRVLVSPQAHRVHHSTDEAHYHKNYGLTFSLWDRLFGTYHDPKTDDPTPTTGVIGFPSPEAERYRDVWVVYIHQLLAPFRKMRR